MDSVLKLSLCLILSAASLPAFAAFPATPSRNGWYVPQDSSNDVPYQGVWHKSPDAAAIQACAKAFGSGTPVAKIVPLPVGELGAGLNGSGKFYSDVFCQYNGGSYSVARGVRNAADCQGTGAPILNYAPATCSGDPPSPSSSTAEQCALTNNVTIPGYVKTTTPVEYACYSGCQYTPTITSIETYDGISYQEGNWKGNGLQCSGSEPLANGGTATGSGGITPGDLARLNQEVTQQQVLAVLKEISTKTGGATSSTNPQIDVTNQTLAEIKAADQAARDNRDDPDGLEAIEQAAVAANPTDAMAGVPASTVDVGNTFASQTGFLPNACPASPTFTVKGHEYTYDITGICSMAEMVSFLVVAFASIVGVRIFIGGNS